jgi:hypothetical protein
MNQRYSFVSMLIFFIFLVFVEATLSRSVEWLLRCASKSAAKSLTSLCKQSPFRLQLYLARIAQQHQRQRFFAESIGILSVVCNRADVVCAVMDDAIAKNDLQVLLDLARMTQIKVLAVTWSQRWIRAVELFGTTQNAFWRLCDSLIEGLGQDYGPLAELTIVALRRCKKQNLEAALGTFGLLIQEFHNLSFWHSSLLAVCTLLRQQLQNEGDASLLTRFFQIMLQPLFYTPEQVVGNLAVVEVLFAMGHVAVSSSDVELLRALAQLMVVLMGERAGENSGEWRRKAIALFGGNNLANRAFAHLLQTQNSVAIEHLSSIGRVLVQAGAELEMRMNRLSEAEHAVVTSRVLQFCRHPRAGELFGKYMQLCSDVEQGLEPKEKILN